MAEEKELQIAGPFQLISTAEHSKCPDCGAPPSDWEIRNYDPMFRDGDIYCGKCGRYIRMYDAS